MKDCEATLLDWHVEIDIYIDKYNDNADIYISSFVQANYLFVFSPFL